MFKRKNGSTWERAQVISTERLPTYMTVGMVYETVGGPTHEEAVAQLTADNQIVYVIREGRDGRLFYAISPYELPTKFMVRKITTEIEEYEILDWTDAPPKLAQVVRAERSVSRKVRAIA